MGSPRFCCSFQSFVLSLLSEGEKKCVHLELFSKFLPSSLHVCAPGEGVGGRNVYGTLTPTSCDWSQETVALDSLSY